MRRDMASLGRTNNSLDADGSVGQLSVWVVEGLKVNRGLVWFLLERPRSTSGSNQVGWFAARGMGQLLRLHCASLFYFEKRSQLFI